MRLITNSVNYLPGFISSLFLSSQNTYPYSTFSWCLKTILLHLHMCCLLPQRIFDPPPFLLGNFLWNLHITQVSLILWCSLQLPHTVSGPSSELLWHSLHSIWWSLFTYLFHEYVLFCCLALVWGTTQNASLTEQCTLHLWEIHKWTVCVKGVLFVWFWSRKKRIQWRSFWAERWRKWRRKQCGPLGSEPQAAENMPGKVEDLHWGQGWKGVGDEGRGRAQKVADSQAQGTWLLFQPGSKAIGGFRAGNWREQIHLEMITLPAVFTILLETRVQAERAESRCQNPGERW